MFSGFLSVLLADVAGGAIKAPTWYEQISGILAIPVTIIGVAYSYVLIKKTRLEVRKTELEIQEKTKDLGGDHSVVATSTSLRAEPAMHYLAASLILRYILFELIVSLSSVVRIPLRYLFNGIGYGLFWIGDTFFKTADHRSRTTVWEVIGFGIAQIGNVAGSAVYWLLFFVIAWPLFKDILTYFGISLKDFGWKSTWNYIRGWRSLTNTLRSSVTSGGE